MSRTMFYIWLLLTTLWVLAVCYRAYYVWPHLPLDISHTDPATKAAFNSAVMMHAGKYALVALLPPMIVMILARMIAPRRR
jgi:hypothetical protein